MELQLDVIQRESYIWQSDKAIRQSDAVIAQSDVVVDNWQTLLFGKSMQEILNYTSESAEIKNKESKTAVIKAVD
jgi:hypothetical protein